MKYELLKSKIHRATVTGKDINYEGSITIGKDICEKAHLCEFEKVDVYNITNGERFTTYVIYGEKGVVELNGAAARCGEVGDKLIIVSYALFDEEEVKLHKPWVVLLNEYNEIKEVRNAGSD